MEREGMKEVKRVRFYLKLLKRIQEKNSLNGIRAFAEKSPLQKNRKPN